MGKKAGVVARRVLAIAMGAKAAHNDVQERHSVTHEITWKDDEGNILDITDVKHGAFPEHDDLPDKPSKGKYDYVFEGWMPRRTEVTRSATYRARFLEVDRSKNGIVFGFYNHAWGCNSRFITYYDDNYFSTPSTGYDSSLTTFALVLALSTGKRTFDSTENADNVKALLKDIGCDRIRINDYYLSDKKRMDNIGVAIGIKDIDKPTVFLVIKGSDYGAEFGGNMIMGPENDHEGFTIAKRRVMEFLRETFREYGLSGDIRILVTGYSRAGATSNLVSTELTDMVDNGTVENELGVRIDKRDLYGFCFEPALCQYREEPTDGRYDNIVCVIDPNDPVVKIPPVLYGFKVFGRKEYLDSNNPDVLRRVFAYMDKYFGEGTSSYYNVPKFIPRNDNKTLGDLFDHMLELSVKSFGDRKFYTENVQDDLAYTIYEIADNRKAFMKVMSAFESSNITFPEFLAIMFSKGDFMDKMVPGLNDPKLLTSTDTKCMRKVMKQVFELLKRFDPKDLTILLHELKGNYKCLITPHIPLGPLSFLMADDPNYRL